MTVHSETFVTDRPEFEIKTWCKDKHGQEPAQVHLYVTVTPRLKAIIRFSGTKVLDDLILGLAKHRNDVWPIEDTPLKTTYSVEIDERESS